MTAWDIASRCRRSGPAALRDRVQQLLAPLAGDERALDSGCGAGALAFALAPFVGSVVGVDLSPELVEAGNELAPANCELIVGDATALPFPYGSFDITGCMRVLHHARRPELIVSELARVTRPGGEFSSSTSSASSIPSSRPRPIASSRRATRPTAVSSPTRTSAACSMSTTSMC